MEDRLDTLYRRLNAALRAQNEAHEAVADAARSPTAARLEEHRLVLEEISELRALLGLPPRPGLADLPPELICKVAAMLVPAFGDVVTLSAACRATRSALWDDAVLWRRLLEAWDPPDLETTLGDASSLADGPRLRSSFAVFAADHAGFLDAHFAVRPLLRRLHRHLSLHAPRTFASLGPPTPLPVLRTRPPHAAVLDLLPHAPRDPEARAFALFYSFADGQHRPAGGPGMPRDHGLFGAFRTGITTRSLSLVPMSRLHAMPLPGGLTAAIFAFCPSTALNLAIVVDTPRRLAFLRHRVAMVDLGPNGARSGRFLDRGPFTSFLAQWVADLESGTLECPGGRPSPFPTRGPYTARAESRGVLAAISTFPLLEPDAGTCGRHAFRLRLSLLPSCPYSSVTLAGRWWTFAYASSGRVEEDPGQLVGGIPTLTPQQPEWEAVSVANGYADSPLPGPRAFPDPGADPVRWMAGRLRFVADGGDEWEVRQGWFVEWPAWVDGGMGEGDWRAFLEGRRGVEGTPEGEGPWVTAEAVPGPVD